MNGKKLRKNNRVKKENGHILGEELITALSVFLWKNQADKNRAESI